MAISEAIEIAAGNQDTKYALGSVLNHVLLHQSIVGLETRKQLEKIGEKADSLIACVGGGSNFAGLVFPFFPDRLAGQGPRFIAVEPTACPSCQSGSRGRRFTCTAKLPP